MHINTLDPIFFVTLSSTLEIINSIIPEMSLFCNKLYNMLQFTQSGPKVKGRGCGGDTSGWATYKMELMG